MFATIFYIDHYAPCTEAVRSFTAFADAKAAADAYHDGNESTFAAVYDLSRLDPSGNAVMVYHTESGFQVADLHAEEAGDRLPFDVEDEDGEWHRILAPTLEAAERQAKRRGIRVSCVQEAEEGAGAEDAA